MKKVRIDAIKTTVVQENLFNILSSLVLEDRIRHVLAYTQR